MTQKIENTYQRDVRHGSCEMCCVDAAQHELSFLLATIDVEGKDGLVQKTLCDHVVHNRGNAVYGNRVESKPNCNKTASQDEEATQKKTQNIRNRPG